MPHDVTTPTTAAGRALNEQYLTGQDGYAPFTDDILAIEAEARAAALDEARAAVLAQQERLRGLADELDGGLVSRSEASAIIRAALDALWERSGE